MVAADARFERGVMSVYKRLSSGGITCTLAQDKTESTIAINMTKASENRAVMDAISDIIITDCKSFYINSKIRLPIHDQISRHVFLCALLTFDRDTDKIIAKSLLQNCKLGGWFNLGSFYDFAIDALKARWDEVCTLANDNVYALSCKSTFTELLKFLIANIESTTDEAHVVMQDSVVRVLGVGLSPIEYAHVNDEVSTDARVIGELVSIAPKRIFMHVQESDLIHTIKDLFGACVIVN